MKQMLSPKEMASAIGVSESSLKRWADDGRIRVVRTMGGHRRISLQEAVRFARSSNLPVLRPQVLGLPEVERVRARRDDRGEDAGDLLTRRLLSGNAEESRAIILDLYLSGRSVGHICDEPIRRAMEKVGELWEHDPTGIAVEHRATDICIQSLNVLRYLIEQPGASSESGGGAEADQEGGEAVSVRPRAIGGAPGGDPYLLPSIMATCVLAEAGFEAINLGPDTPLETLALSVSQQRPSVAWLSSSTEHAHFAKGDLDKLTAAASEAGCEVVVGGRCAPVLKRQPGVHVFASMSELSGYAHARVQAGPRG